MRAFAKKLKNIYLLSFLIPVLGMLGIFIARGIFPFGNNSFMFSDMYHQYVPFLTEFWRKLHEGESLAFSWRVGLGSNFVALYAYYLASPENWLAFFCPEKYLIEFMTYIIVLKIGLMGLTFSYYLSRRFHTKDLRIVWFSVFYAMSGFVAAYNWNHMWLNCLWLAPLIILGLEELVKEGRVRLYCLTLAAAILTNYYLSILLCIFLVLYFIMQLFTNHLSVKKKLKAVGHFTLGSLLAGGMAGVLLVPVMYAMHVTDFHDISFPDKVECYFNVLEMVARHAVTVPAERRLAHWPNIYCGVLAFVLVPVYFFHKRIPLREKIGRLLLLAVFLLGFSVNILNFIWHGLNYPDSLPARQSFLYIFVVLTMCFEAVHRSGENGRINQIAGVVSGLLLLAACGIFVTTEGLTVEVMACTWIFLAGYIALAFLFDRRIRKRFFKGSVQYGMTVVAKWAVLLLVCAEAVTNMAVTSVKPVQRAYYLNKKADYQVLLSLIGEEEFCRLDSIKQMCKNDGTLAGYPSASVFSSTINGRVEDYYDRLGMGGNKVSYYYQGATPFTSALLGVGYTFSEEELKDTYLYEYIGQHGDKYLYRNKVTLPVGVVLGEEEMTMFSEELRANRANAVTVQNKITAKLCGGRSLFRILTGKETATSGNRLGVQTNKGGHLYGIVTGKPEGKVVYEANGKEKELTDVSSAYVLDLGWHDAGEVFHMIAEEEGELNIKLYRLNEAVLDELITKLIKQPFEVTDTMADGLKGTVTVKEAGTLVFSIPYEPGWHITADGEEVKAQIFADTMLAVPLTEGEHEISLQYEIAGAGQGLLISVISVLLFAVTYGKGRVLGKSTKANLTSK